MIAALRTLGHEVRVVAPGQDERTGMGGQIGWVHWLKSALPKALYEVLELGYSLVAFIRIARAVREFQPDVIYERYNLFMMGGVIAKRVFRVPLVLEVNGSFVWERAQFSGLALKRLARWSEQTVWSSADHVLPITLVLAKEMIAGGIPESRITVIPNGVNAVHFARAPNSDTAKAKLGLSTRLVLGFAGFVREWHCVDGVIRWMGSRNAPRDVHFLIVGDGPARPELERLASELGVAERVTFTGTVPRDRVPEYMAAFDIALQTALKYYASPIKLFEYLALGKAILAPRQPNMEEIVADGQSALLYEPTDEGLALALDRIVADAGLRSELGAGAKRAIGERGLTWLDHARRVSAVCDRLVGGPRPQEDQVSRTI
jgi:glycosyltransferase involved in cell wall biosynthesis